MGEIAVAAKKSNLVDQKCDTSFPHLPAPFVGFKSHLSPPQVVQGCAGIVPGITDSGRSIARADRGGICKCTHARCTHPHPHSRNTTTYTHEYKERERTANC